MSNERWWVTKIGIEKVKFIEDFNEVFAKVFNETTKEIHFVMKVNLFETAETASQKFIFG